MFHEADDIPRWTDNFKLMTREQLNIPGLHMMGHASLYNGDEEMKAHFHKYPEFVVVVKGRQQYAAGEKKRLLYGNEMIVTDSYELHGNYVQDICEMVWFQIDLSVAENFLGLSSWRGEYLFNRIQNYHTRVKKISKGDVSLLKNAFYLLGSKKTAMQVMGYNDFLEFVLKNLCTEEEAEQKENNSEDIERALSFIHENLLFNPSNETIAEQCSLSVSRFKAKFKEQMGVTPHSYMNALKIDSAKVYLKNEKLSVTEIAHMLNFSSSNHFASVFKKYAGCTPTKFREQRGLDLH